MILVIEISGGMLVQDLEDPGSVSNILNNSTGSHKNVQMFRALFFMMAKMYKEPKGPLSDTQTNNIWHIHAMPNYFTTESTVGN